MKRSWTPEELVEHWSVTSRDLQAIGNKSGATRLGFVAALKYFQCEGRFPRGRQDVPWLIVSFLATHVKVPVEAWNDYRWENRVATYHRAQIRDALGFREVTSADGDAVVAWLLTEVVATEQRPEHLLDQVIRHCKQQRIEPPTDGRIQRFIDSALRQFETLLYARTTERLSTSVRDAMDALIRKTETTLPIPRDLPAPTNWAPQTIQNLRTDPGRAGLATFLREVAKLRCIHALGLPANLFAELPSAVLHRYRQRVDGERPSELLAHPDPIRATLLAAWLVEREQEITDTLVDLLIHLMHRIVTRAEEKVETAYVTELKRVANKHTLLFRLANAALEHPEGTVREVLFPMVSEATLRELVAEGHHDLLAHGKEIDLHLLAIEIVLVIRSGFDDGGRVTPLHRCPDHQAVCRFAWPE